MLDCGRGYKRADIYFCRDKCRYIELNKGAFESAEFKSQCCCECGIRDGCENMCDMIGNNTRGNPSKTF